MMLPWGSDPAITGVHRRALEEEYRRHVHRLCAAIAREEARHAALQRRILRGEMLGAWPWVAGMADWNDWAGSGLGGLEVPWVEGWGDQGLGVLA